MRTRYVALILIISAVVIVSGTVWTQGRDPAPSFTKYSDTLLPDEEALVATATGLGFGQQIAGTYDIELHLGIPPAYPLAGTGAISLHADGTLTSVSNACCGSGAAHNVQSEGLGNWKRTGTHQIELSAKIVGTNYDDYCKLGTDYAGLPPCDDGETLVDCPGAGCNFTCTASQSWDFEPGYQAASGYAVTYCTYASGAPDLCTANLPFDILVDAERMPVEFPACPEP